MQAAFSGLAGTGNYTAIWSHIHQDDARKHYFLCAVCDYLGEKLAYFFGITSPKFQYALTELDRMQEEEKEEEEIRAEERRAEEEFIVQTLG